MLYFVRSNILEDSVVEIAKFINCTAVLNGKSVTEYLNARFDVAYFSLYSLKIITCISQAKIFIIHTPF